MKNFYIHDGNEQKGPFSVEDLEKLGVTKDTNIWYEGMQDWKKASEIEELKILFAKTPPAFNKPAQVSVPTAKRSSNTVTYIIIAVIALGGLGIFYFINQKGAEASIEHVLQENEEKKKLEEAMKLEEEAKRIEKEKLEAERKVEEQKRSIRNSHNDYISVRPNNYSIDRLWGGISNLYFEATNKTDEVIDVINVEVKYIKADGGLFKAETVQFKNIPAKSSIRELASGSNRGTKMEFIVKTIHSKNLSLCYEWDKIASDPDDPYRCN